MVSPDFLTVKEVAARLAVSSSTVLRKFSRVPGTINLGAPESMYKRRKRCLRIRREALEAYISDKRNREAAALESWEKASWPKIPRKDVEVKVFVRHSQACKHHGNPAFRRCKCWKHLRWSYNGRLFRLAAGTRRWSDAGREKIKIELCISKRLAERGMV